MVANTVLHLAYHLLQVCRRLHSIYQHLPQTTTGFQCTINSFHRQAVGKHSISDFSVIVQEIVPEMNTGSPGRDKSAKANPIQAVDRGYCKGILLIVESASLN
jgi:hypothetical protein